MPITKNGQHSTRSQMLTISMFIESQTYSLPVIFPDFFVTIVTVGVDALRGVRFFVAVLGSSTTVLS